MDTPMSETIYTKVLHDSLKELYGYRLLRYELFIDLFILLGNVDSNYFIVTGKIDKKDTVIKEIKKNIIKYDYATTFYNMEKDRLIQAIIETAYK